MEYHVPDRTTYNIIKCYRAQRELHEAEAAKMDEGIKLALAGQLGGMFGLVLVLIGISAVAYSGTPWPLLGGLLMTPAGVLTYRYGRQQMRETLAQVQKRNPGTIEGAGVLDARGAGLMPNVDPLPETLLGPMPHDRCMADGCAGTVRFVRHGFSREDLCVVAIDACDVCGEEEWEIVACSEPGCECELPKHDGSGLPDVSAE